MDDNSEEFRLFGCLMVSHAVRLDGREDVLVGNWVGSLRCS